MFRMNTPSLTERKPFVQEHEEHMNHARPSRFCHIRKKSDASNCLPHFCFFMQSWSLAQGQVLLRVGRPTSVSLFKMIPQRLAQRFVSNVIVEPVVLTVGINRHRAEPLLHFLGVQSVFSKFSLECCLCLSLKNIIHFIPCKKYWHMAASSFWLLHHSSS